MKQNRNDKMDCNVIHFASSHIDIQSHIYVEVKWLYKSEGNVVP